MCKTFRVSQGLTGSFSGSGEGAEQLIADVFSAVAEARSAAQDEELILKLRERIARIKREATWRPIKQWAGDYVLKLADLPLDVMRSFAQAYGRALAR